MRNTFVASAFWMVAVMAIGSILTTDLQAEDLFAVDADNNITVVDTTAPGTVLRSGTISGLAAGETIFGIDFRANGGGIFAVSSADNVYTINPGSFLATQVGTTLSEPLAGNSFAYDFNPSAAGGILSRIISDTNSNRVINSTTGAYALNTNGGVDQTDVFYAAGDANEQVDPNIQGIAYDNNILGATATQQFGIDQSLGILTTVANNAGTLTTIGSLGITDALTSELAFDISGDTGVGFASLQTVGDVGAVGDTNSDLYTINLDTGAAELVGSFGSVVRDFTILPEGTAIPEPSSAAFLSLALAGFCVRRRNRR